MENVKRYAEQSARTSCSLHSITLKYNFDKKRKVPALEGSSYVHGNLSGMFKAELHSIANAQTRNTLRSACSCLCVAVQFIKMILCGFNVQRAYQPFWKSFQYLPTTDTWSCQLSD